jgi:Domain of unknown function (DUF1929)/Glyoxal oxidase N-terminus/PKD domain/Putative Ig domain
MPTLRPALRIDSLLMRRLRSAAGTFVLVVLVTLGFQSSAEAQANVQGQWNTLSTQMPINPVHVALMHTGKVLIVSGSGNLPSDTSYMAAVWDPATDTVTTQPLQWDMFCNGMVVLPDGRPFVMGGTMQYDPFLGQLLTSAFDPVTGNFLDLQSMAHGRWYPTATTLSDGSVMVFSGFDENSTTNQTVEIYKVSSGWSQPYEAPFTPPLYPRMHLLPNGSVFNSGSQTSSALFNPSTHTWTVGVATTNYSGTRTYGTSVLLPLTPANNYDPRVIIMGGGNPATATTEIIDMGASKPAWVYGPSMSEARTEMDAVILPNGKVLAVNGSVNDEDSTTASLNADLYDPASNTFSSAGANAFARLYHSGALLLPDATVLVLGGNPERGTYEPHMEIYSPAYLFASGGGLATRPTITSVTPSVLGYGSSFQIQTPNSASISSAVLVRAGSPTHAFDMDQRLVGLNFTVGSGVLNATAPPNGSIAPPGYYLLFILNSAGVPSLAEFVQLSLTPTDQPPTGTITSPSNNVSIGAGQSVSFAGTGTSSSSTIASYLWAFPGGSPASSSLADPGAVTFSAVGTYTVSLTVTDSLGSTDPSPPTRTITVTAPPSITSVNSTSFTVGTAGSFTVTTTGSPTAALTESGSLPNPVTFKDNGNGTATISGTPATGTAGFYPITITASNGVGTAAIQSFTLTVAAGSGGGIKLVQHTSVDDGIAALSSASLAFPSNNTVGNWIGVGIRVGQPNETITVKDSKGNSYHNAIQINQTGDGDTLAIFYAEGIAAGANTVTVSVSSADTLRFAILEFSGVAPSGSIDRAIANQGSNASANSGTITTTANGDLLLGAIMAADEETFTAGSGFQIVESVPAAPNTKLIMEYQVQALSGSTSSSATLSSADPWAAGIAAFKAGAAGTSAPTITSANSASFAVNSAGSFTVTTTGSPTPTLTESGALPSPVTFKDNGNGSATISGTPATGTAGTYSITITASNGIGTPATQTFTLAVDQGLAITSANSTTFTVGTAGTFTVTTTGFPTPTLSDSGSFPSPVTFKDNGNGTATISGTPATGTAGTYAITITASNEVTSAATQNFTLTVATAGTAPKITSASSTTFTVGTAGTFSVTTSGSPTPTLSESGSLPSPVTFKDNGNGTATLAGTPATGTAGTYPITITANNGVGTAATQSFTLTVAAGGTAPKITSASSTTFTVGTAGTFSVTTTGSPTPALSESGSLPSPVTFKDNGNGTATLAGTPATGTAGTYPITITASNGVGTAATQSFTLTVSTGGTAPKITSASSTTFTVGTAGTFSVTTTGSPTPTLSESGSLPSTVTFKDNGNGTATLAGTPATGTAGGYPITITASNGVGTAATQSFTLTVAAGSSGGIKLVQHTSVDEGIAALSSASLAFPSNNTVGNWIGVGIRVGQPNETITVKDSKGNTYHNATQINQTGDGDTLAIFYAENIAAGANTVTISVSSADTLRFAILEFSGVASSGSIDGAIANQGSNASPNSGSITTTTNGDLLLGAIMAADEETVTAGTGYQIVESVPAAPDAKLIIEYQVQASSGSASSSAKLSSADPWAAGIAAFKP